MRPLTVVTLIILGSCFAIMVSLAAVIVVVLVLGDESPRLQHEFDPLLQSFLAFLAMTAICALSFYGLYKERRWRYLAQIVLWAGLLLLSWPYWR